MCKFISGQQHCWVFPP